MENDCIPPTYPEPIEVRPYPAEAVAVSQSTHLVSELPEWGKKGDVYILVDSTVNPTECLGLYTYKNGWIMAGNPTQTTFEVVEELPEEGKDGVLYFVPKEGETDTFDEYRYINNTWIKVDTDIKLYSTTGDNEDGAMTQAAVTTALNDALGDIETALHNINSGSGVGD